MRMDSDSLPGKEGRGLHYGFSLASGYEAAGYESILARFQFQLFQ